MPARGPLPLASLACGRVLRKPPPSEGLEAKRFAVPCRVPRLLLELRPFLTKFFGERGCLFTSVLQAHTSTVLSTGNPNPLADLSRGAPGAPSRASATAVDAKTAGSLSCAFPLDAADAETWS